MSAANPDQLAAVPPPAAKSRLTPILLGLNSLLLLGVIGGGAWMYHGGMGGKSPEAVSSSPGSVGPTVRPAEFVIRLRNSEVDRFAQISFEIEVATEPDKDRLNAQMPKIRDSFISYLSDRTLEDLRGSDALGQTKQALATKLKELAPDANVRGLYVTHFIIQ